MSRLERFGAIEGGGALALALFALVAVPSVALEGAVADAEAEAEVAAETAEALVEEAFLGATAFARPSSLFLSVTERREPLYTCA